MPRTVVFLLLASAGFIACGGSGVPAGFQDKCRLACATSSACTATDATACQQQCEVTVTGLTSLCAQCVVDETGGQGRNPSTTCSSLADGGMQCSTAPARCQLEVGKPTSTTCAPFCLVRTDGG